MAAAMPIRMGNPARKRVKKNVGELLIFGNPRKKGFGNHKAGCGCAFCKRAAKLTKNAGKQRNSKKLDAQRKTRERGERIRTARLNPKKKLKRATRGRRRTDRLEEQVLQQARRYGRNKRKRRNPSETTEAVRLFQGFHGHDPKEIAQRHVSAAVRLDYTALGDLLYLRVETPLEKKVTFSFDGDGVKLASSPDGKQLYCIGGDQNILPTLDERSREKDFIDLGDALEVAYLARKVHGNFQPVEYYHEFGEVNGTVPRLMFDKLRKQLFFVGGDYFIDITMRAPGTPLGKVSPGIEN